MSIVVVSSLDWPEEGNNNVASIQCAGEGFVDYQSRRLNHRIFHHGSSFHESDTSQQQQEEEAEDDAFQHDRNLLEISHEELEALTYYQVLGGDGLLMHASTEQVKRAYHKACLLYHPDKTGRGEEDEVFLKVKAAFDVLSDADKRRAYDSSIDFDDSIPKGGESSREFYSVYAPVFDRNLRFDARNDPNRKKPTGKRKGSSNKPPPSLGNSDTPLDEVHGFYDYWINFDSWRDFSLAAQEQEVDGHSLDVDNAESRYEKRWIQKEIDKRAKSLKKQEMVRITTLVERAMAADPRLKRQRQLEKETKERLEKERLQKVEEERVQAEAARVERELQKAQEQEQLQEERAQAKAQKEREKKQLRKARQSLRKCADDAFEQISNGNAVYKSLEDMHDDVELLCCELSLLEITQITTSEDDQEQQNGNSKDGAAFLVKVHDLATTTKDGLAEAAEKQEQQRLEKRAAAKKEELAKAKKAASNPWTKEELSALARAVKKYPAGGANRWETISLFVNNVCKPQVPRTKEECIEKYNQIANQKPKDNKQRNGTNATTTANASAATPPASVWTDEQDKQLQQGLAKYPASMDKNERWTLIAKGVDRKGKKECVQRFKAIRQAIKNK